MPSVHQSDIPEPLVVSSSTDINGSVSTDTIVKKNRSLHVRGNLADGLTIEPGADVLVDGKIINRGGRLVISHKRLTACITMEGPSESEAGAVLKINLTSIALAQLAVALRIVAEGHDRDPETRG
jgi:hypothetical protein